MKFPFQPASDRIFIKPFYEEGITQAGLIIPEAQKPKPQKGEVVAVGPGRPDQTMEVQVGDIAIFSKHHNREFEYQGEKYLIVQQQYVLIFWTPSIIFDLKKIVSGTDPAHLGKQAIHLDRIKVLQDVCIVKPDPQNDHIQFKDGTLLYIDTSFEPEKHSIVKGTVMKLPFKLHPRSKTDIELQVGDKIWFHYLAMGNAQQRGMVYYEEGKTSKEDIFVGIEYETIFLTVRGEEVIPINGNILCEALPDDTPDQIGSIHLTELSKKKYNEKLAVVRYVGAPKTGENSEVKVGDVIVYSQYSDIPLEYDLHKSFEGGKLMFRMSHADVDAIVRTEKILI